MDGDRDLRIIWRPESEHSIARFRRPNSTFDRDDRGQFAGSPMAVSGMISGTTFGRCLERSLSPNDATDMT
tara:strand:- start:900 stop:1112 length:213 start_codon:yes stop_codon:yes gene_type:complete